MEEMKRAGILLLIFGLAPLWGAEEMNWQECLAEAARYHPDLIVAVESITQAEATVVQTRASEIPQLSAEASLSRTKRGDAAAQNASSVGLNASMTLFDAGANRSQTRQAQAEREVQRRAYTVTSAQLRYELRTAFVTLWQAQENIVLSESILNLRLSNEKLVSLRYESGIEHRGALLSARANTAQARANLSAARRNLRQAQVALSKAMGLPLTRDFFVKAISSAFELPESPDFELLAKVHPTYLRSLAAERAAREGLKQAQAAYWPSLNVSAGVGRSSNDIPPEDNQLSASASVSYTLFDGFAREAGVQKARSAIIAAEASTRSAYNTLFTALRGAYEDFQNAIDAAEVQKAFLEANTERERIAQAQYGVGLLSYDNWTIIEDNFVSSKQAELNARAAAFRAEAVWQQAKGVPLPEINL